MGSMKKLSVLMRKCKSLSRQLGRSASYSGGGGRPSREGSWTNTRDEECERETVYVGRTRRRYVIDSKYLSHPLINALIEKPSQDINENNNAVGDHQPKGRISIKCEVVLFDHLLWMLENADPKHLFSSQSLEELAELYMV